MRRCAAFLLAAAGAAAAVPAAAAEPPNLGLLKTQVTAYYASGAWNREVAAVDAQAQRYVDARLHAGVRKPAIVLDIDDTALSDVAYERSHDYGFDAASYNADVRGERFPAIAPTLALVRHAAARGIAIFFITGRREPLRAVTAANLAKAGYPAWAGLVLRPAGDRARSVIPFKSRAREHIAARGYHILAALGDQQSDLRGGASERSYKLPNPMYFIP